VTIEADGPPWTDYPNSPNCHANVWRLGPRGGAAVNIRCTRCGQWFNTLIFGWLIPPLPPREEETTDKRS
jgi:hypothetical protein